MRNYCEFPGDIETGLAKEGGGTISLWACLSFQWGDRVSEGKPHSVQMWNLSEGNLGTLQLISSSTDDKRRVNYRVNLTQEDVTAKLFLYPSLDYNSVDNLDSRQVQPIRYIPIGYNLFNSGITYGIFSEMLTLFWF